MKQWRSPGPSLAAASAAAGRRSEDVGSHYLELAKPVAAPGFGCGCRWRASRVVDESVDAADVRHVDQVRNDPPRRFRQGSGPFNNRIPVSGSGMNLDTFKRECPSNGRTEPAACPEHQRISVLQSEVYQPSSSKRLVWRAIKRSISAMSSRDSSLLGLRKAGEAIAPRLAMVYLRIDRPRPGCCS